LVQRPITKLARVHRSTQKFVTKGQDTQRDSLYNGNILIIIPRKIKLALTGEKNKIIIILIISGPTLLLSKALID
jgi:hypothetical protein